MPTSLISPIILFFCPFSNWHAYISPEEDIVILSWKIEQKDRGFFVAMAYNICQKSFGKHSKFVFSMSAWVIVSKLLFKQSKPKDSSSTTMPFIPK